MESPVKSPAPSPRVVRDAWGRLEVEGGRAFKDAKLYPGGAREWDWGETGTHHQPGIQPADVAELVERGAEVVVLSKGRAQRLQVRPETIAQLEARGIRVHVLETGAAIALYNDLCGARPVGALIHSTC